VGGERYALGTGSVTLPVRDGHEGRRERLQPLARRRRGVTPALLWSQCKTLFRRDSTLLRMTELLSWFASFEESLPGNARAVIRETIRTCKQEREKRERSRFERFEETAVFVVSINLPRLEIEARLFLAMTFSAQRHVEDRTVQ